MKKKSCLCGNTFNCPTKASDRGALKKAGHFSLFFAGVDVGINRRHFLQKLCPDCSRIRSWREINRFIHLRSDGKIIVFWNEYLRVKIYNRRYINDVLIRLGRLSCKDMGNLMVMYKESRCMNPRYTADSYGLFFTLPDDAVAYAKACKRFTKHCKMMRIGHTFST